MNSYKKIHAVIISSAVGLSALAFPALADIKEIPAEEMTESYIRDTTIIVPKQQQNDHDSPVSVTVQANDGNPELVIKGDAADPNNNSLKRPDLTPLTDDNLAKLHDYSIQQQHSSIQVPPLDLSQAERDRNLREVLKANNISFSEVGVPETGPIDYSKLNFPTIPNFPQTGNGLVSGSSTPGQIIISIPQPANTGSNQGLQNLTPGGEYQMKIDNGQLQFIINNPNTPK